MEFSSEDVREVDMGDSGLRSWNWQVPALEPRTSSVADDSNDEEDGNRLTSSGPTFGRRLSLPAHLVSVRSPFEQQQKISNKVSKLREALASARNEFLELRQEASDLQEYSSIKLTRVTRYLGVLSDKTRKLDQLTLDYEHRLAVLRKEKSIHFNEVVSRKGNTRVVIRAHPKVKDETTTAMSFPDDYTILINNSREEIEFRFDQVYGPHVSQGEFFQDIQPLIQSAIDGYNVSIFACGPRGSGKTYTLEGPSHDRGVYFRAFEELFDLSNGESTPTSKFTFYVTMFELCNEQVEDLLKNVSIDDPAKPASTVQMESCDPLVQHKLENPTDFARVFKAGLQNQHMNGLETRNMSSPFLVVTFHVHYTNTSTGEKHYSKLSLVDLPGSEQQFSSLVGLASALVFKREPVPYEDSKVARILSDSLGGDSKTLLVLNISPSDSTLEETKSWLKMAKSCCDSSRTLQNMIYEEQNKDLKLEVEKLRKSLQESEDQCALLFKEVQKAWKGPNRADNSVERSRFERDQIVQLRTQVAQYARFDRDQKAELANRASKILALEDKLQQLAETRANKDSKLLSVPSATHDQSTSYRTLEEVNGIAPVANDQLGEELSKRDELIERLHEENEKLFQRLTERSTYSPKVARAEPRLVDDFNLSGSFKNAGVKHSSPHKRPAGNSDPGIMTNALQKAERTKTTPAGEYLTAALLDFDPDQYNGPAAVSDAANKLLMLVLAAVIKAGAAREHDMLEEIRGAVFAFIRKLEPRKLMDTMLVSRVRILYVRSLLAKSPELQAFKVPAVERFLEKAGSRSSRTSSTGSSPTKSPVSSQLQSNMRKDLLDEHIPAFRINLKQEKTSKLSSIVLKLRGIDQETWRQHLTGAKLREMNEEARNYAVGNKRLAALFVHTPAGELQRQIRSWLAESFDFLSLTAGDNVGGAMGQLELLSTAIMDGWMAGLGIPTRPSTDSLGQLLSDYTKHVYMSQLQHFKDVAATLATEEAEDLPQVTKIRTALESIDHKRRKILQQMRNDVALLTKEEGGSPVRCPSTASEEARIASLISLEDIINQTEEIRKEAPKRATFPSKKKFMLSRLDSLLEQTSALLSIDHPCAHKFIKEARRTIESAAEQKEGVVVRNRGRISSDEGVGGELSSSSGDWGDGNLAQAASEVVQWSVLQFNNGTDMPFIIKCGANSLMQLVIKAQSRISQQDATCGKEVVAVVPSPSSLAGLSSEEIKQVLEPLPEAFRQLAMARTADGTRARYSRLYKTLAVRVPALRSSVSDIEQLEKTNAAKARTTHARRASDSDNFSSDY